MSGGADNLERQFQSDRATRDAAWAVVQADIAHVRAELAARSIPNRIADRIKDGAADVVDEAVEVADTHRGALAGLVTAIVLWFARHPLIALITGDNGDSTEDRAEREDEDGR